VDGDLRNAARTDANQAPIIKSLRDIGVSVEYIKLPVDLLVWHRGRYMLMEVKMPGERLTKGQVEFIATWPGEVAVVHNTREALEAVLGKECMA
jgi:hypothetical protein